MLCVNCGKELEEGRRFCVFCGAEQEPAPRAAGRTSPVTKVVIGVVAALLVAGAGVGIYLGVRGTSSSKTDSTTLPPPGSVVPPAKSEKLAFIDGSDIYTVDMDGSGRRKITSRGDIVDFAVSPDGAWIAFVAAPGTRRVIYKMGPDGSNVSQVTLPDNGLADNPAFDPTGRYIYFTRVSPEDQADIEEARPYGVGFERYDIAANKVDHLYTYGGLQEQSIQGLFADPAGGALYFNHFGSDYPSSIPHKLSLGPPARDTVYMPMLRDTGKYTAVAFQLTGFSRDGAYVSYFKQVLFAEQDPDAGPTQEVDACFRSTASGDETAVATYVPAAEQQGEVSGMEFSRVAASTYYFSKVDTGTGASSLTLDFYRGRPGGSPALAGLNVSIALDAEQYAPLVWHLLAVKK